MGLGLSREAFEKDKGRYEAQLAAYRAQGLPDGHILVETARRRLETVKRVLTDPAYGLVSE